MVFLSKPLLANNIIRDTEPDWLFAHTELRGEKACYTRYNNLEGYPPGSTNLDADPLFRDRARHLGSGSPCIDAGENAAVLKLLSVDRDGETRFIDDPATPDTGSRTAPIVDIGADEY